MYCINKLTEICMLKLCCKLQHKCCPFWFITFITLLTKSVVELGFLKEGNQTKQGHMSLYSSHCENKTYTILYYTSIFLHAFPYSTLSELNAVKSPSNISFLFYSSSLLHLNQFTIKTIQQNIYFFLFFRPKCTSTII